MRKSKREGKASGRADPGEGQERPRAPGTRKGEALVGSVSQGGLLRGASLHAFISLNKTCAFPSVPSTLQRSCRLTDRGEPGLRGQTGDGSPDTPHALHRLAHSRPSVTT